MIFDQNRNPKRPGAESAAPTSTMAARRRFRATQPLDFKTFERYSDRLLAAYAPTGFRSSTSSQRLLDMRHRFQASPTGSRTYTFGWTPPITASGLVTFYPAAVSWAGRPPPVASPKNVYIASITLAAVTVTVDGKPAYLRYVSPTLINAQAPDDTTSGNVAVVVTNGGRSTTGTVTLRPVGPSFSLFDQEHVAAIVFALRSPDNSG